MTSDSAIEQAEKAGKFRHTKIALVWAALVVLGYAAMVTYSVDAANNPAASVAFPPSSRISYLPGGKTLVVFFHPQCPCSRATAGELESLINLKKSANLRTYAVISQPSGCSSDFVKGQIYDSLTRLSSVQIIIDKGDIEAQRFGAKTSGQALLFDGNGQCLFSGGITAARGELGDNAGVDAIAQNLAGNRGAVSRTPVFGCSLESPN